MPLGAPLGSLLLLWPLLVTCAAAQELPTNGVNGYSLHPPYFNLAEGTKITATATCGEDDTGRSLQDLYCKLVGGPVSGDPSQTIQVSRSGTAVVRFYTSEMLRSPEEPGPCLCRL